MPLASVDIIAVILVTLFQHTNYFCLATPKLGFSGPDDTNDVTSTPSKPQKTWRPITFFTMSYVST